MDLTVWFRQGTLDRLQQDSNGSGCVDLKQWFDAAENVRAEYRDTTGDCKTDVWSYFENGRLIRQGRDTRGRGRPDLLDHLDATGAIVIQEVASDGRHPDKKLYLDKSGAVSSQCLLNTEGDKLTTRATVAHGVVVEVLSDSTGNGIADTREIYENNQRVRVEADTNGDRKVDVVQSVTAAGVAVQEEDTDFDGSLDRRFEDNQLVESTHGTRVGADFGPIGCGSFHRFWWKR